MIPAIEELERVLAHLPGLGRRSAARVALALVRDKARLLDPLASALAIAKRDVVCCSHCGAFTDSGHDPCALCSDAFRDSSIICVVEDPADIVSLESSGVFRGRYHVLGGKLSPVRRTGLGQLRVAELLDRVSHEGVREVLLATSTDMDGDATAEYLTEQLVRSSDVKVTRLAFGLPADSGVAYSDPLTLKRAILARR